MALILLYCGEGKGKTSACLGQALRALGHGFSLAFGQFIKRDGLAGEQLMLKKLLGERFFAPGLGFVKDANDRTPHREAALSLLSWGLRMACEVRVLILDELLYALEYGLILEEEVRRLIDTCTINDCHLVLSGRNVPNWLLTLADACSTIINIKHPFSQGHHAEKGIDF